MLTCAVICTSNGETRMEDKEQPAKHGSPIISAEVLDQFGTYVDTQCNDHSGECQKGSKD